MFTVVYQRFDSLVSDRWSGLTFPDKHDAPVSSHHTSSPLQLANEVRETLSLVEGQMEQPLANNLFPVYLSLQAIHKDKAFLQKRSEVITLTPHDFRGNIK